MSMFSAVCKKSRFLRLTVKNSSLTLPRLSCRANRDRNNESRPLSDSFQRHEFNGSLRLANELPLKIAFLR